MEVGVANLADADVRDLIALHQRQMYNASPPGTSFALDLSGLERPDVTVFDARQNGKLLGIGALMQLSSAMGEIKSMRTKELALRRGVGQALLDAITFAARDRSLKLLVLETGTGPVFEPANRLYLRNGFARRSAFGNYVETEFNVFYEKRL